MAEGTFQFNKKMWCLCVSPHRWHIHPGNYRYIYTHDPRLAPYLMWKVEGGSLRSISAMDAHEEWHRSVQQVMQWCRNNGQVDVLPLEWEQQGGDAL